MTIFERGSLRRPSLCLADGLEMAATRSRPKRSSGSTWDDRRTKDFLRDLVHARAPLLKDKSGQWYWLNDWRRTQLRAGKRITYADLAKPTAGAEAHGGSPAADSRRSFQQFHHGFQGGPSEQGQEPRRGGGGLGVHQVRSRTEDLRGLRSPQVQPGVINMITTHYFYRRILYEALTPET